MKLMLDASNLVYKELNLKIKEFLKTGCNNREVIIQNVLGHRYIGDGLKGNGRINIYGIPGNDLGAFMDGPVIEVFGNGQDGIGNTMNSGKIIIHGDSGDIPGYSMRGGEIYVEKNTGFRGGIHMKEYRERIPVMVIGGSAGDFLGEYMAGGIIIILGLHCRKRVIFPFGKNEDITGNYTGTGMHGGKIYIRGNIRTHKLGKEVKKVDLDSNDICILNKYIDKYNNYFNSDKVIIPVDGNDFVKLIPYSLRPYGKLYAY
jgi:glutamate synthase domain-containing protein 3